LTSGFPLLLITLFNLGRTFLNKSVF
jgi:hypothetical protein